MKLLSILYATLTNFCLWQGARASAGLPDGWKCVVEEGKVECEFELKVGPDFHADTCHETVHSRIVAAKKLFFEHNPSIREDQAVVGKLRAELPSRRPAAGEFVCDYYSHPTGPKVNEDTCKRIAAYYRISPHLFFRRNPQLDEDCKTVEPKTKYCIGGYIEPLRAWDGLCGPPHKGATCVGTGKRCCNSETWRCGDSEDDCRPGTCYEGACLGADVYSIDGKCGSEHGDRRCVGKWGDCCNLEGRCGTGPEFCDISQCQSGRCDFGLRTFQKRLQSNRNVPWLRGNTTDGTCGGPNKFVCNAAFGTCCSQSGKCGSLLEHCGDGCKPEFGHCFTRSYDFPPDDSFRMPVWAGDI